ncbi:hypothetical protein [Nocardia sp. CC201C]|uniref:hypothetical protein n=1 Tax=Nocardia sp. CC201C TaxID=3044575 RepID=UPI0024A96085|nr:hypothetical protein [Nocardia sp. CC201C]
MEQVTARAEQAFGDWAIGEIRTLDRTPAVNTLISDGRLTVLPEPAPRPDLTDEATASTAPTAADLGQAQATAAEQIPALAETVRGRRRRSDKA